MSTQIQLPEAKPTFQEIEQALINVVKAGIYYRKPKDGKFMQSYKERVKNLRQAEDPDEYILENAKRLFPDKDKYQLYYKLAKDYFNTEEQVDEETEDFLNY